MGKPIFDHSKLNGRIREKYGTHRKFAKAMGISEATLSSKLTNKTYFNQCEVVRAMDLLGIDAGNESAYFFTLGIKKT